MYKNNDKHKKKLFKVCVYCPGATATVYKDINKKTEAWLQVLHWYLRYDALCKRKHVCFVYLVINGRIVVFFRG